MNGRELESGGHHYAKDFRRGLTPECSVTYSPSLESHPWSPPAGMLPGNRRYTSPHTARPTAPAPHPSLVFEIRIFIRRTGRAEPRRMVPRFAIATSCEDYRTNPILAVTYFTSLIESVS